MKKTKYTNEEAYRGMTWVTSSGRKLLIEDMKPDHVHNTAMLLHRRHNSDGGGKYNKDLKWVPAKKTKLHMAIDAMNKVHKERQEAERETRVGKLTPILLRLLPKRLTGKRRITSQSETTSVGSTTSQSSNSIATPVLGVMHGQRAVRGTFDGVCSYMAREIGMCVHLNKTMWYVVFEDGTFYRFFYCDGLGISSSSRRIDNYFDVNHFHEALRAEEGRRQ